MKIINDTWIYSLFRRLFRCKKGVHRFVEVVPDDPTEMYPGYYCLDCFKFVPKSRISAFRATCEVYDDM